MDGPLHNSGWGAIPARAPTRMQIVKHGVENRSGAGHPGNLAHGRAVEIAYPDADGKLGRETDRPVVPKIGARPGFAGHRIIEAQSRVYSKSESARGIVAQDIGDLPDQFRAGIPPGRGWRIGQN